MHLVREKHKYTPQKGAMSIARLKIRQYMYMLDNYRQGVLISGIHKPPTSPFKNTSSPFINLVIRQKVPMAVTVL